MVNGKKTQELVDGTHTAQRRLALTQHTQVHKVGVERLQSNVIEAAEQCGNLSVPTVREPVKFDALLSDWDASRRIIFCDEDAATNNPLGKLGAVRERRLAVLIGPEGGFSESERKMLRSLRHPSG